MISINFSTCKTIINRILDRFFMEIKPFNLPYESIRALMPSVGVDLGEADLVLIELIDLVALQLGNLVLN